jgi:hypothetical protein
LQPRAETSAAGRPNTREAEAITSLTLSATVAGRRLVRHDGGEDSRLLPWVAHWGCPLGLPTGDSQHACRGAAPLVRCRRTEARWSARPESGARIPEPMSSRIRAPSAPIGQAIGGSSKRVPAVPQRTSEDPLIQRFPLSQSTIRSWASSIQQPQLLVSQEPFGPTRTMRGASDHAASPVENAAA